MKSNPYSHRLVGAALATVSLACAAGQMVSGCSPQASARSGDAVKTPDPGSVSATGGKLIGLKTAPVTVEAGDDTVSVTGQANFSPDRLARVAPRLSGQVRSVSVRSGDTVRRGQTLATMDSTDAAAAVTTERQSANKLRLTLFTYQRVKRQFDLGTPDVTAARAALEQTIAHEKSSAGILSRVRAQAKIGGFSQKPLEDAETLLAGTRSDEAQARADLATVTRERDRQLRLVEIGVGARRDGDAAEDAVTKAKTTSDTAREKVRLAERALTRETKAQSSHLYDEQSIRAAESDYQQAQLQRQAAERGLRLARAAILRDLQQAESDRVAAGQDLASARNTLALLDKPSPDGSVALLAPIARVVVDRSANPGQVTDPTQMLFTLADPSRIAINADVYEKDAAGVRVGAPVTVTSDALPGWNGRGRVSFIASQLNPATHTVTIRTEISGDGRLKDGM